MREDDTTAPFWVDETAEPGRLRIGLSEAFLESLSESGVGEAMARLVGLELLAAGSRVRAGEAVGFVHLAGRTADLRAPFGLTILVRNEAALADTRLVATSPYGRGWLFEARRDPSQSSS